MPLGVLGERNAGSNEQNKAKDKIKVHEVLPDLRKAPVIHGIWQE